MNAPPAVTTLPVAGSEVAVNSVSEPPETCVPPVWVATPWIRWLPPVMMSCPAPEVPPVTSTERAPAKVMVEPVPMMRSPPT